jgi:hypothetical protein
MIYSRFLHTESQGSIACAQDETQYLIFSTPQSHTPSLGFRKSVGLQRFAVLWNGEFESKLITIIEEALIARMLSPIKALQIENGRLDIVIDQDLNEEKLKAFVFSLDALVRKISEKKWFLVICSDNLNSANSEKASVVEKYNNPIIRSAEIGILDYSPELSLMNKKLPV